MSLVPEIIEKLRESNAADTFVVREGNFFGALTRPSASDGKGGKRPPHKHPLTRFLLLVAELLLCLALLICLAAFLSMDLLLHRNDYFVNNSGTLVTRRDCQKETSIFLLNASELWHDTGIQLKKGDRFCITWSGGCYGAIDDLRKNVVDNNRLSYNYISPGRIKNKKDTDAVFCMYSGKKSDTTAYFGQLIYQIQANPCDLAYSNPDIKPKRKRPQQIFAADDFVSNRKGKLRKKKSPKSGKLFVSINDLYLSTSTIDSIYKHDGIAASSKTIKKLSDEATLITKGLLCEEVQRLLNLTPNALKETLAKSPNIFFDDNIGNLLVCVEVYRKTPALFSFTSLLRPFTDKNRRYWLLGILVLLPIFFIALDSLLNTSSDKRKKKKSKHKKNRNMRFKSMAEFEYFAQLYVASLDMKISRQELEMMNKKMPDRTKDRVFNIFKEESDLEVVETILSEKGNYLKTPEAVGAFVQRLRQLAESDTTIPLEAVNIDMLEKLLMTD